MKLEITNPQSPLHCSVMLQERRKSGVPLTPDFCREILTSSANQSVAGKLLDMIENRLSAAPQEIDAYLPYVEAMVSRTVATPKIIEKAANLVNEFFPYDNYTAEEYAFACRFAALKKHTANSACIAQKLLKRVKNGVRGDAGTVYNPEIPVLILMPAFTRHILKGWLPIWCECCAAFAGAAVSVPIHFPAPVSNPTHPSTPAPVSVPAFMMTHRLLPISF